MKKIQARLAVSLTLKASLIGLAALLLASSLFLVWWVWNMPREWEKEATLANYEHNGEFDYTVDVIPGHLYGELPIDVNVAPPTGNGESKFFRSLIRDINLTYNYDFAPDYPATDVSGEIDIVAIIHGPSDWQKEVLLERSEWAGVSLSDSINLELEDYQEIVQDIEDELELMTGENFSYSLTIEARLAVQANTGQGVIRDSFVHPLNINVGRGTIEMEGGRALERRRYQDGFSYKHISHFGYSILIKSSELYGPDVTRLKSEPYESLETLSLPPGEVYFTKIVDIMKGSFSYQFRSTSPTSNVKEEVEVVAILKNAEVWQKTFTLVPKTIQTGDIAVEFPVDIRYFSGLTSLFRDEIGMGAANHQLIIQAEVHTVADTQYGTIEETFSQALNGTLGVCPTNTLGPALAI